MILLFSPRAGMRVNRNGYELGGIASSLGLYATSSFRRCPLSCLRPLLANTHLRDPRDAVPNGGRLARRLERQGTRGRLRRRMRRHRIALHCTVPWKLDSQPDSSGGHQGSYAQSYITSLGTPSGLITCFPSVSRGPRRCCVTLFCVLAIALMVTSLSNHIRLLRVGRCLLEWNWGTVRPISASFWPSWA